MLADGKPAPGAIHPWVREPDVWATVWGWMEKQPGGSGLSCHKSTIIGHVSSSTQLSIVAVKMIQHSCEPY